jgi:predicted nucleic acid-binding protein
MSGIIVADAGPLHYIILVDCADLLPKLFQFVLIPPEVRHELLHRSAPRTVKDWMTKSPSWLRIERVHHLRMMARLHKGEAAALQLALQAKVSTVLMDDLDGRAASRKLGLTVIGTIGVLERLSELKLIDLAPAIAKLRRTNCFVSDGLLNAALERDRQRRSF